MPDASHDTCARRRLLWQWPGRAGSFRSPVAAGVDRRLNTTALVRMAFAPTRRTHRSATIVDLHRDRVMLGVDLAQRGRPDLTRCACGRNVAVCGDQSRPMG